MTNYFTKRVFALTALSLSLVACCGGANKSDAAVSGSNRDKTTARPLRTIPAGATHCRIGHEYKKDPDGNVLQIPLIWFVREASLADFASGANLNFEIVRNYENSTIPSPPFVIDKLDRSYNTINGNTIDIDYRNAAGQPSQSDFTAALTMRKFGSADLWVQGTATPANTGTGSGTVVMFARPVATTCQHSKLITSPQPCRRVLIEYFDDSDTLARQDFPQTSGPSQNIFPISHDVCKWSDTGFETSDGDGHEGPP